MKKSVLEYELPLKRFSLIQYLLGTRFSIRYISEMLLFSPHLGTLKFCLHFTDEESEACGD